MVSMNERITWSDLPPALKNWVENTLEAPVESYISQSSGFSLGTADRLTAANSKKAFLKAVSATAQPETANLHRAELAATRLIAGTPHTASIIGGYQEDSWVALLMEDIEGRHPQTPWTEQDIIQTLIALDSLASLPIEGIEELDDLTASIEDEFKSWERIAQNPLRPELYTHLAENSDLKALQPHFDQLNTKASSYAQTVQEAVINTLAGNHLVHSDLRADNILLENNTGEAIIIDWPFACHGAAYFDSASILADVVAQGGDFSWETVQSASKILRQTPQTTLEGLILAYTGYYLWAAQIPSSGDTNSTLPAFRLKRALNLTRWILNQNL